MQYQKDEYTDFNSIKVRLKQNWMQYQKDEYTDFNSIKVRLKHNGSSNTDYIT